MKGGRLIDNEKRNADRLLIIFESESDENPSSPRQCRNGSNARGETSKGRGGFSLRREKVVSGGRRRAATWEMRYASVKLGFTVRMSAFTVR